MFKLKIPEFSLILIFFFMFQLGACAKEVPVSDAQESIKEQITPETLQDVSEQVFKTEFELKEPLAEESNERIVVASAETVETSREITQVQSESKPQVQLNAKEKTAAQLMLNLDQYKGKVVYLDFWASWCVPCQQTFPWMDKMQKKYPDDIVFVAVNFGESPDDTVEFLKRFPADIKFVYDPLVQIASEYGVPGLPYSFIYGRKGELLGKHAGFSGGSEINLEAALKNLFESGE